MIDERFVFLAALCNLVGAATYIKGTIQGTVRPNRVSWFVWAVAPLMAFTAEVQKGVGLPAVMTFMVGFTPLLVFLASFVNRHSVWKLGALDIACGALSFLGLLLWWATREGSVAIVFGLLADGLAVVPTLRKAYTAPATEDDRLYLLSAASAGITLLTVRHWDLATAGFPVYILAVCLLLFVIVRFNGALPRPRLASGRAPP